MPGDPLLRFPGLVRATKHVLADVADDQHCPVADGRALLADLVPLDRPALDRGDVALSQADRRLDAGTISRLIPGCLLCFSDVLENGTLPTAAKALPSVVFVVSVCWAWTRYPHVFRDRAKRGGGIHEAAGTGLRTHKTAPLWAGLSCLAPERPEGIDRYQKIL